MDNQILKDNGKTQLVFQEIKIQFQHRRNPYPKSSSRKRTSQDGTGKDQSHKEIEDTNKNQECRELS